MPFRCRGSRRKSAVAQLFSLDHMSIWLTFILCYLLFGLGCYVCIMHFFPPHDAPPHDPAAPPPTESELREIKPRPFALSDYLSAIPGLLVTFVFAPLLLTWFIWLRARTKKETR